MVARLVAIVLMLGVDGAIIAARRLDDEGYCSKRREGRGGRDGVV